uniref:Secreted protein n=1 Tax=Syphacia muris TaxID=451379 RepID=A0A0N5AA36_9BILA
MVILILIVLTGLLTEASTISSSQESLQTQPYYTNRGSWPTQMRRYRKWTPLEPSVRFASSNPIDPFFYGYY